MALKISDSKFEIVKYRNCGKKKIIGYLLKYFRYFLISFRYLPKIFVFILCQHNSCLYTFTKKKS